MIFYLFSDEWGILCELVCHLLHLSVFFLFSKRLFLISDLKQPSPITNTQADKRMSRAVCIIWFLFEKRVRLFSKHTDT